jgi:hypothetical protein
VRDGQRLPQANVFKFSQHGDGHGLSADEDVAQDVSSNQSWLRDSGRARRRTGGPRAYGVTPGRSPSCILSRNSDVLADRIGIAIIDDCACLKIGREGAVHGILASAVAISHQHARLFARQVAEGAVQLLLIRAGVVATPLVLGPSIRHIIERQEPSGLEAVQNQRIGQSRAQRGGADTLAILRFDMVQPGNPSSFPPSCRQ